MPRTLRLNCLLLLLLLSQAATTYAQTSTDKSASKKTSEKSKSEHKLKKYSQVIPANARTKTGLFTVHFVGEKVYYEIPPTALDRDMVWATEAARVPAGLEFGGFPLGDRVVRWERSGNRVLLRNMIFKKRGAASPAIERAVAVSQLPPIIQSFDVETEGKDHSPVIEVTKFLSKDVPEFSARSVLSNLNLSSPAKVDDTRSYVQKVEVFPLNVEAMSFITYSLGTEEDFSPPPDTGDIRSATVLVHYSMALLPEKPMRGRYSDPRVGYFTADFQDYDNDKNRVEKRGFIIRRRLEKKNPEAEVSEPVKQVVYYISHDVPEKWRPYIKQGVEAWNVALEAAGFRNTIVCKNAPSAKEDPNWSPDDVRYSVVRWAAEGVENSMGPNVHDPRTGEVISAHIILWQNVLKLMQDWYFVECSPLDARAQKLPIPESLEGELLRYVTTHEVGHTLGLRHNNKASSAYTIAQLRSPAFTDKYGTVASIMSYGRFNYVAQPEDHVTRLIPKIGPYDIFAIQWGYTPLPQAKSSEAEKPILDKTASRQLENPWLRFGGEDGPAVVDPTVKTENIGSDPIDATALGLKNLRRVADLVVPATAHPGKDFSLLKEEYDAMLYHYGVWQHSVVKLVGGVVETRYMGGQGVPFARVPKEKQQQAVQFLLENAFTTPKWLLQPQIINRFQYFEVDEPLMKQQKMVLDSLLSGTRMQLLADGEMMEGARAYSIDQFVSDVQNGLWSELNESKPVVDVYRRGLQREYLSRMDELLQEKKKKPSKDEDTTEEEIERIKSASPRGTDFPAVARAALSDLSAQIEKALPRSSDRMTIIHLRESQEQIKTILRPCTTICPGGAEEKDEDAALSGAGRKSF